MVFHMDKQAKRKRRSFTPEFKAEAVRLVLDEQRSVASVARDLDLMHTSLSDWVERERANRGTSARGTITNDEREELNRLRKEVRDLRMDREILKKAAAFFAKDTK